MPRIPSQTGPQVSSRALPTPFDNGDTRGSRGGEILADSAQRAAGTLQQGAAQLGDAFRQEKDRANASAIMGAEAELDRARNELLFDSQQGFIHRRGERAIEASTGTHGALAKRYDAIAGQLTDEQRPVFEQRAASALTQTRTAIERHVAGEIDAVGKQRFEALETSKLEVIRNNFADEAGFKREMDAIRGPMLAELKRRGVSTLPDGEGKSAATLVLDDFKARALEARLQGYIGARDGKGARALLQGHREALGARAKQYESVVQALNQGEEIESTAAGILRGARKEGYQWVDAEWALDQADALPDGDAELKAGVRRLVEHQVGQSDRMRDRAADERMNRTLAFFAESKSLNDPRIRPLKGWFMDPENGHVKTWLALEERIDREAKMRLRGRGGGQSGADARREQARINLEALTAYDAFDPSERVELELGRSFPGVDQITMNRLTTKQKKDVRGVSGGGLAKEADVRRMVLQEAGSLVKGDKDRKELLAWTTRWYEDYVEAQKDEPTLKDVRAAIVDALTVGDEDGGSIWSRNKRRFKVGPGQKWKPLPGDDQDYGPAKERLKRQAPAANAPAAEAPAPAKPAAPAQPAATVKRADAFAEIPDERRRWVEDQLRSSRRFKDSGRSPTPADILSAYNLAISRGAFQ